MQHHLHRSRSARNRGHAFPKRRSRSSEITGHDEAKYAIQVSLILDNARYQRCNLVIDLAATLHIELLFLPPYSPNLNLIERLGKFVKKKCLYAQYYPTFDAFTASIQTCLNQTNTTHLSDLQSLLTLNFQTFENCNPST
jgi:transposase